MLRGQRNRFLQTAFSQDRIYQKIAVQVVEVSPQPFGIKKPPSPGVAKPCEGKWGSASRH
jgi:hypothetical protein